jgi:hypothetical protein
MRPVVWEPPEALSAAEQAVVGRIKRAKLFPFLRRQRRALFSVTFQEELATLYQESERGQPPVPPAKLALVTIVQAYTRASDDEAIEALTMDRRWQLVLDCLDAEQAPFGNVFASLVWSRSMIGNGPSVVWLLSILLISWGQREGWHAQEESDGGVVRGDPARV